VGEAVYSRARAYAWRVTRTYSGHLQLGAGAIQAKVNMPGLPKAGGRLDLSNTKTYNAPGIKEGNQRDGSSRGVTQEH